jgi:hypothetical protein
MKQKYDVLVTGTITVEAESAEDAERIADSELFDIGEGWWPTRFEHELSLYIVKGGFTEVATDDDE